MATRKPSTPPRPAPSTKPLAERLRLPSAGACFAPNVPREVASLLPRSALTSARPAVVTAALLFARDQAALAAVFAKVAGRLSDDPLLWIAYPKGGSGVATDLSRDRGWAPVARAGLRPVAQIAVDATWSALRFRFGPARKGTA